MDSSQKVWEQVLQLLAAGKTPTAEQLASLSEEETVLLESLQRDHLIPAALAHLSALDETRDWEVLQAHMPPAQHTISWRRVIRYAAAIVIPLALAGGTWLAYQQRSGKPAPIAALPPVDHQRATLVLADGSEVALNGQAGRTLQQAGASVSKEDSTTLVYKPENSATPQTAYNKLIVPRGAEYSLVLADGTSIKVNAASSLRYPVRFDGQSRREIFLESGEVYLDVAPVAAQPFVVHTGKVTVEVLGTGFNINTYTPDVQTTLVSGKIKVSAGNQPPVIMQPGQQAVFNSRTGTLTNNEADITLYTAWKDGWMIFDNERLEDVMQHLGRWYDYDVQFSEEKLKNTHFGGKLRKYQDITDVLAVIKRTGKLQFRITGKTIYVSE